MNADEARHTIATMFGGQRTPREHPTTELYRFPTIDAADKAKAVLDAFHPDYTGAVVGAGVLYVARVDPRPVGLEAKCGACGETFNPNGEDDLIHAERADGEPCGGQGELTGAWR